MRDIDGELEQWLVSVAPRAIAYALSLVGHLQDAEDVVHDVICRLISHREYDLPSDGEKLLFRSITNACINRRTRARQIASLDAASPEGVGLGDLIASDKYDDPVGIAMTEELSDAIGRELANLPPLQRAAVELRSLGRSLKEIGEILGINAAHAGVLIHRGRELLSRRLAPYLQEKK